MMPEMSLRMLSTSACNAAVAQRRVFIPGDFKTAGGTCREEDDNKPFIADDCVGKGYDLVLIVLRLRL